MNARPRNDGRGRAVWPPVAAREGDPPALLAFVEPEPGKLRVFRCRDCGVRVAQEADLVGARPSVARGMYGATFGRTFNLVATDDSVCCVRCGKRHFGFDERDPALLTLPLFDEAGDRVFDKGPARCFIVMDMCSSESVLFMNREETPPRFLARAKGVQAMVHECLPDWDCSVTIVYYLSSGGLNQEVRKAKPEQERGPTYEDWVERRALDKSAKLYRDEGLEFMFMFKSNDVELLAQQPVQELCILFKFRIKDMLCWTNWQGADHEKCMLGMWMLCGGNFLFADWYIPGGCGNLPNEPGELDFVQLADDWVSFTRDGEYDHANCQPAFSQLVRDGNWLGWWKSDVIRPSSFVYERVRLAMENRLLYPNWRFLHDFPESTFADSRRRTDIIHGQLGERIPPTYASQAQDAALATNAGHDGGGLGALRAAAQRD